MNLNTAFNSVLKIAKWPATVLVAFNLENRATKLGLGNVMSDSAGPFFRMMLDTIQSAWVQLPALLVLGGSLALWIDRKLRPTDQKSEAVDRFSDNSVTRNQEELLPQRIYIGGFNAALHKIEADGVIELVVRYLNATGGFIVIGSPSGVVGIKERSGTEDFLIEPKFPTFLSDRFPLEIPHLGESMLVFELRVPQASADVLKSLVLNSGVFLDLRNFRLQVSRPLHKQSVDFPFPREISLRSNPEFPLAMGVIFVEVVGIG